MSADPHFTRSLRVRVGFRVRVRVTEVRKWTTPEDRRVEAYASYICKVDSLILMLIYNTNFGFRFHVECVHRLFTVYVRCEQ